MPKLASVAPCFLVADVGATIRWYEEELGFSSNPFPPEEPHLFAILWRDQVELMLQRLEGYVKPDLYSRSGVGVWDAYFRIQGVADLYETIKDKLEIMKPLRRQPYGLWEFEVRDLNGYVLVFSEPHE